MKVRILVACALLASAGSAFAQTNTPKTATGTNSAAPTLAVKATLAKAVQLTLNTGTGCTVNNNGGADFSLDFGTVDALGISAGACSGAGAGKVTTTSGGNKAIYYTDYTITPSFTNQGTTTGSTLSAYVSSAFLQNGLSIVQSNSAHTSFTDFNVMSTASSSPTDVAGGSSNVTNNTALTRYVGVLVDGDNAKAASSTSSSAVVTYTLTVQ